MTEFEKTVIGKSSKPSLIIAGQNGLSHSSIFANSKCVDEFLILNRSDNFNLFITCRDCCCSYCGNGKNFKNLLHDAAN